MGNQQTKTITILLTRYSDLFSNFLYAISNRGYTHVSISLDEDEEFFYSFTYKGFSIEKPRKRNSKKIRKGSACIRLQVSESTYEKLERYIKGFIDNREMYHYSRIGIVLCLFKIPHKFKNNYFCSQFVAEMLIDSNAVELKKDVSLYLPNDLMKELCVVPFQSQIVYNVI